jgi:hypothetical protein
MNRRCTPMLAPIGVYLRSSAVYVHLSLNSITDLADFHGSKLAIAKLRFGVQALACA